ncbi:MAG TPA: class I lanthipeptide [Frankiaceae bacterium]|nr:class I lanthipeptide [Frankiaceae bacterium]
MRTRTLRLNKETLTRLDTAELASVVGGLTHIYHCAALIGCNYTYCIECVNDWTFEFCPTPTLPVEQCV